MWAQFGIVTSECLRVNENRRGESRTVLVSILHLYSIDIASVPALSIDIASVPALSIDIASVPALSIDIASVPALPTLADPHTMLLGI
jgi:hypothetical protein